MAKIGGHEENRIGAFGMKPIEDHEELAPLLDKEVDQEPRISFHPKLLYFTLNMSLYSSLTFTSAYFFDQLGVPIHQFGAISALSMLELVGAVWWGGLADRTGNYRTILLFNTAMYCGSFCGLPLVGWLIPSEWIGTKLTCSTVLLGGTYFCMSSFFPLIDTWVLRTIKQRRAHEDEDKTTDDLGHFGRQRLWGTVGHAVVSVLSAQAISSFGWMGMFAVLVLTCLAFGIIVHVSISDSAPLTNDQQATGPQESLESLDGGKLFPEHPVIEITTWSLLKNFNYFLFLLAVLLTGYVRGVLSIFLPYHLMVDLKQSPLFVGLTAVFRISAEILIFGGTLGGRGRLSTRGREVKLLLMGLAAGVIRVGGYGGLECIMRRGGIPLWLLVLLLESLKGVSVACTISGAVRLAHDLVPPAACTRSQALVSGTYSGLSTGLAGLLGGAVAYALPNHRLTGMFQLTAVVGFLALIGSLGLLRTTRISID